MLNMVILIGLPASGKSTFYNRMFSKTHLRINLDMLKTRTREKALIDTCLLTKTPFVVDNTNVKVADRKGYILLAKEHGFLVHGYYIASSVERCLAMNDLRQEKVPRVAILAKKKHFEYPSINEGFDSLFYVHHDFSIEPWKNTE